MSGMEQPAKPISMLASARMLNLGHSVHREICIDENKQVWWRLLNTAHTYTSQWFKGDPR